MEERRRSEGGGAKGGAPRRPEGAEDVLVEWEAGGYGTARLKAGGRWAHQVRGVT